MDDEILRTREEQQEKLNKEFDINKELDVPKVGIFFKKNDFPDQSVLGEIKDVYPSVFSDKKLNLIIEFDKIGEYHYSLSPKDMANIMEYYTRQPSNWIGKRIKITMEAPKTWFVNGEERTGCPSKLSMP